MTLYLIGIGLWNAKDISVRGLEAVRRCHTVYLEGYTSKLGCSVLELEELYGKKVTVASRTMIEGQAEELFLNPAKYCASHCWRRVWGYNPHRYVSSRAKYGGTC